MFSPQLDNHEIKPGKVMKINISVPNLRLFVGNIPKSKGKEEILDEFGKLTGKVCSKLIAQQITSRIFRGSKCWDPPAGSGQFLSYLSVLLSPIHPYGVLYLVSMSWTPRKKTNRFYLWFIASTFYTCLSIIFILCMLVSLLICSHMWISTHKSSRLDCGSICLFVGNNSSLVCCFLYSKHPPKCLCAFYVVQPRHGMDFYCFTSNKTWRRRAENNVGGFKQRRNLEYFHL